MSFEDSLAEFVNLEVEKESPEVISSAFDKHLSEVVEGKQDIVEALERKAVKGATFGFSELLGTVVEAELNGEDIDITKWKRDQKDKKLETLYPGMAMGAEILGSLPTSAAFFTGLKNRGMSTTMAGAIEGGLYGTISEGPVEGAIGAAAGGALGRIAQHFEAPTTPSLSSGGREGGIIVAVEDAIADVRAGLRPAEDLDAFAASGAATDDDISKMVFDWAEREHIKGNRHLMEAAEDVEATRLRELGRGSIEDYAEHTLDTPPVIGISPVTIGKTVQHFTELVPDNQRDALAEQILRVVRKKGGLRFTEDVAELAKADKVLKTPGASKLKSKNSLNHWYRRNFLPISENIRSLIDPKVAAYWERAVERTVRVNANYTDNYMNPMKGAVEFVNNNEAAKRLLLDMWHSPENLDKFRKMLPEADRKAFDNWWGYSKQRNEAAMKRLFQSQEKKDKTWTPVEGWDENFIHTTHRVGREDEVMTGGSSFRAGSQKEPALRTRSRKLTKDMDQETLDAYENPLLSHSKYVSDQEQLLQIGERFGLRPSLAMHGGSSQFFKEMERRLLSDGFDEARAHAAASAMHEAYMGAKRAPPAPVRAFMNLAYAGTLAQFKTAVLNLHDLPVSMVNNGALPTMKGVFDSMEGEFGKTVRGFLGNQNTGEFIQNHDMFLSNPSLLDKFSAGSKKFSDGAMLVSGFRNMDEVGKGGVLRGAVNLARDSARDGTLKQKFTQLFDDRELDMIQPWLASGKPVKEFPEPIRALVEDLAFARLGEQQLISIAGRPMGYVKHELLRPAYAMTGFAIKQQALLRKNVLEAAMEGRPKEAAAYAAKYVLYAGLGYGMINELRNAAFKGDDFEIQDVFMGTVDQVAAAMTLNRLGDDFSRTMFMDNPVEFLMASFLPPGGYGAAVAQGLVGDFEPMIYRMPAIGDPIKMMFKKAEEAED